MPFAKGAKVTPTHFGARTWALCAGEAMIVVVRKARAEDAKSIAAIGSAVWIDTYAFGGMRDAFASYVHAEFSVAHIEEVLASRTVIVAEVADHLVGYAVLVDGAGKTEIDNFYVLPRFQNRGVGREMIAYIAREHSLIWLACWEGNQRAIGFYKSLGFSECGESLFDLHGEKYRNVHLSKST